MLLAKLHLGTRASLSACCRGERKEGWYRVLFVFPFFEEKRKNCDFIDCYAALLHGEPSGVKKGQFVRERDPCFSSIIESRLLVYKRVSQMEKKRKDNRAE